MFFWFCLILSIPKKLKVPICEMPVITHTLNISNLRATSAKSINCIPLQGWLNILWKRFRQRQCLLLPFWRYCCRKVGRYCDRLAQRSTWSKSLKVPVKNQTCIGNLFKLLEKGLNYQIWRFWIIFKFFRFCLSRLVLQKLKNSIIEMPIVT